MSGMTKGREQRLRACEKVLTEHGKQWVAVGHALAEIRDSDLYKEAGYSTWAKYLAAHEADFGIGSKSQADDYIRAARVAGVLPKPDRPSGQSGWGVKHAVQLDRLPTAGAAKKVANTLLENGKPPTVSVVKKAVDKALGIKKKPKPKPKTEEVPMFEEVVEKWTDELKAVAFILDSIPAKDLRLFRESEPRVIKDLVRAVKRVDKSLERLWAALPD